MSTVHPESIATHCRSLPWMRWLPIGLGLLALYAPTFYSLFNGIWRNDDYMHGPIVLAVVLWLIWQRRRSLLGPADGSRLSVGVFVMVLGLIFYVLGRSQDILIFEVGSLIPVLVGVLLAMRGWEGVRVFGFPIFFVLFMLPLPGMIVDSLTGPLKQNVSAIAEHLLYTFGYPVARNGVILTVGQYQLLVADACSGLHSLISMSAMGLLYIYLMGYSSRARNAILLACLLPIAFVANVVRVVVLALVTYHFGDEAGQGFIHDFSGIFLFIVGLLFLFAIDGALGNFRHLAGVNSRLRHDLERA